MKAGGGTLSLVILASVLFRAGAALVLGDTVRSMPGIHDQISYDMMATQVLAGRGFTLPADWWPAARAGEPTAHWSYLYTLFLAGVYAVVGHHPLAARLLQALLAGVLQPWLTWRIGRRLFSREAALAAAGLSAAYAYFVYYASALMTESFFIVSVLWVLDLATGMVATERVAGEKANGDRAWRLWLLLGFALGLAALLRQTILVLAPLLLVWLVWRMRAAKEGAARRAWAGALVTVAVAAALIAPWTIRNYRAFGRFVPLNTNAGYVFFWGNHPIHGTSFIPILPAGGPSYEDLIPEELRSLDEAALDRALLREGLGFVRRDPVRYAALSLSRTKEYFKFWWSTDSGWVSNLSRVLSFGVLWPFMLLGLGLSLSNGRLARIEESPAPGAAGRRAGSGLLFGFVVAYSLVHLLSWALIRYRLPVDAVLIVFAGVGLVWIRRSVGRR